MFSRLSSFHTSFLSSHPFFSDTSVELFPLSKSTLNTKLAQSVPSPTNSDHPSVSNDVLKPTPDTHLRRSTQALEKTHTWDYVDLPLGKRSIGCKWIYKIKTHSDDTIKRSQEYGIDYEETFAHALRAWFATFSSTITFASSPHDTTLFIRQTPYGIVLLLLYVDDMIITGNDPEAISDLQNYLGQHFEMKDLGFFNYFLGLEVSRLSDGYLLSQVKYPSNLLARSGITNSNTTSTLLDPNVHLTPFDGVPLEDFIVAPQTIHFTTLLRILHYIKKTLGHGLWFLLSQLVLSGYLIQIEPWILLSTIYNNAESEYRALADATAELLWFRWPLMIWVSLNRVPPSFM
ncbi:putative mitochondrial protein [Cucumis melo var. makuwa]|uniref:Mitochondrial protein n=1 Tax=Cucumis melo var. makuwa TaxID=1194695 RepID=A0A5A7T7L0_CUCMM|nr:putative mitochondrial protein [Cucumis melo var. makuwa]TYJ97547.1 putative mitochondrial protein [Cucumis melo var. makuwa]